MTQQETLDRTQFIAELRGLAPGTRYNYRMYIRLYQEHFDKPADKLDITHVQKYMHHLYMDKGMKKTSLDVVNSALRFLYRRVLEVPLNWESAPKYGRSRHLPEILTREEVLHLLDCAKNLRDKCILMTTYGAGLRISEVAKLRVSDIDSKRMQIFIRSGKGDKDRYAILSQVNLELLREYWKTYRPRDILFRTLRRPYHPLGMRSIQIMLGKTLKRAGIEKHVTMHTLRHSFATHLLEDGANLFHIKQLLGHSNVNTTCWYLRMISGNQPGVQSPLDRITSDE